VIYLEPRWELFISFGNGNIPATLKTFISCRLAVDVIFDMTRKLKNKAIVFFIAVYFEPQINQNFKVNQKLNLPNSKKTMKGQYMVDLKLSDLNLFLPKRKFSFIRY
jgi:ADP-heptose:LPS heptosyltransferase